jgi:deoxyribonuclease-4
MSMAIVKEELDRGRSLGAKAVMTHMGSAWDADGGTALERVVRAIETILDNYRGRTKLLVENAAGSGTTLGKRFEELAFVAKAMGGRCGVCLDTQHAFASGYDLRTADAVCETLDEFDRVVGLEHLQLIHCNDSMTPLAGGTDRHEHIGKGKIGKTGFAALLHDARLARVDFVTETKTDGSARDVALLKRLRGSVGKRYVDKSNGPAGSG